METMADTGADIKRPANTMDEAIPQELASPVELAEQEDATTFMGANPQQASVGEVVDMMTKGTP